MQGFELNRTNRLQLINLAPTNLLELLLVIKLPIHAAGHAIALPNAAEY